MWAVTAIISLRKRRSTPRRLFDKSGPISRTLFRDIPLNFAEELNTPQIWSGFFRWYIPNNGKYQHFSLFCSGALWYFRYIASIFLTLHKRLWFTSTIFTKQQAKYLDSSIRRNPKKREHMVEFMRKILDNNHAEVAPPLQSSSVFMGHSRFVVIVGPFKDIELQGMCWLARHSTSQRCQTRTLNVFTSCNIFCLRLNLTKKIRNSNVSWDILILHDSSLSLKVVRREKSKSLCNGNLSHFRYLIAVHMIVRSLKCRAWYTVHLKWWMHL
jgi:hypothetical protein